MREEKQFLLEEMKGLMGQYGTFMIMKYAKLSANSANEFRREVSKSGGNVEVLRKRMLVKAAAEAGVALNLADLPGHIGIVFTGEDPVETTKLVFKFRQENDKTIEVLGGYFEGKMMSGEDVEKLSKLPSLEVLRAQFLGTLEAPMSHTLGTIEALLTSVIYCLENKSKGETTS